MVWDALFADSITLDLVDYVFVAMLLYIRDARTFRLLLKKKTLIMLTIIIIVIAGGSIVVVAFVCLWFNPLQM